ncbi:MAG: ABC transporter [Legionellales bacterium]|nr:ABC transporter [Legionellales bacterium]|tara:strand:+ start:757 stop:1407 length:651 start_codon:yes stop_codon:yes gene_type:complete
MGVLIELRQASKSITVSDSVQLDIIKSCSLSVSSGESVAIVGPSGSGKTTLLNLMAGFDQPTSGEVNLFGQPMSQMNELEKIQLRGSRLSFVFQDFHLLPALTALENITYLLTMHHKDHIHETAHYWLEQVGLSKRSGHLPSQLSGGECQRVAIARAFALGAELILADEPTGNLDKSTKDKVVDLFFECQSKRSTAVIIVTHDLSLADRCGRQLTL